MSYSEKVFESMSKKELRDYFRTVIQHCAEHISVNGMSKRMKIPKSQIKKVLNGKKSDV